MGRITDFASELTDSGSFRERNSRSIDMSTIAGTVKPLVVAALFALSLASVGRAQDPLPSCGEWPFGNTRELALDEQRNLLFASSGGAVVIQEVSNPSAPVVLSDAIRTKGVVADLFYDESNFRLYIAADEGGLEVWGTADATAPTQLGTLDLFHHSAPDVPVPAKSVVAQGDRAYVAVEFAGIQIIDVTEPTDMFRGGRGRRPVLR